MQSHATTGDKGFLERSSVKPAIAGKKSVSYLYLFIIRAVFFSIRSAQADGKNRRLLRALFGADPPIVGDYGCASLWLKHLCARLHYRCTGTHRISLKPTNSLRFESIQAWISCLGICATERFQRNRGATSREPQEQRG